MHEHVRAYYMHLACRLLRLGLWREAHALRAKLARYPW